jgi:hypothetical protein
MLASVIVNGFSMRHSQIECTRSKQISERVFEALLPIPNENLVRMNKR